MSGVQFLEDISEDDKGHTLTDNVSPLFKLFPPPPPEPFP